MKAIETNYNGYRFRSRLEARWAVFFDTLNIDYLYENEGFILPQNGYYLPDFYLPKMKIFIEVKGTFPTQIEKEKAQELANESGCLVCIIFGGIPSSDYDWWCDNHNRENSNYMLTFTDGIIYNELVSLKSKEIGHIWGSNDTFLICDQCGKVSIENDIYFLEKCEGCKNSKQYNNRYRTTLPFDAFRKARMARFEHREKPS